MRQLWLILSWFAALSSAALAQGGLTLPERSNDPVTLKLSQAILQSEAPELLQVFVGPPNNCCTGKLPMVGAYKIAGKTLTFQPAFDFISGQSYSIRIGSSPELTSFIVEAPGSISAPKLLAIHPSGPMIPENTLRFYLHFSEPMMPHRAAEFIQLVDAKGVVDDAAFMSFTQELWNADRTRLTLLMDPGRIKRGVAQNVELGPALNEGRRYSIAVKAGWPTALGNRTLARTDHSFWVSSALRHLPNVAEWKIQTPKLGTREALVLTFDRPFDHQLVQRAISLKNVQNNVIHGTIELIDHENIWRFQPNEPWRDPIIQLHVDPRLEDVAGNNFQDLLDHPIGEEASESKNLIRAVILAPI